MKTRKEYVSDVARIAQEHGHTIQVCRGKGDLQVDFGHKKLRFEHIRRMYPEVLYEHADIARLIDRVAPGRPCAHAPFRRIVRRIRREWGLEGVV